MIVCSLFYLIRTPSSSSWFNLLLFVCSCCRVFFNSNSDSSAFTNFAVEHSECVWFFRLNALREWVFVRLCWYGCVRCTRPCVSVSVCEAMLNGNGYNTQSVDSLSVRNVNVCLNFLPYMEIDARRSQCTHTHSLGNVCRFSKDCAHIHAYNRLGVCTLDVVWMCTRWLFG